MSVPLFLAGRDLLEFSRDREQRQQARRTAHQDPPGCDRPDLASSLNNLSASLADLGRREDALAAIEEAARCPDAYYQLEQSLRLADWLQHGEATHPRGSQRVITVPYPIFRRGINSGAQSAPVTLGYLRESRHPGTVYREGGRSGLLRAPQRPHKPATR